MSFYIIRDENSRGDVATVWNWRKNEWCWDIDGVYAHEDGFGYTNRAPANARIKLITRSNNAALCSGSRKYINLSNVRVVDYDELKQARESKD